MKTVYIYESPYVRIGNYLWQYFSLLKVKQEYDIDKIVFLFDLNNYLGIFEDKELLKERYEYAKEYIPYFINNVEIVTEPPLEYSYYIDYSTEHTNDTIESTGWLLGQNANNIIIGGFFQNINNVYGVQINIPHDINILLSQKYYDILTSNNTISVNIRRWDFVDKPEYNICSIDYYKNAMALFGNKNNFLFISDDIEWCKEIFKGDNYYFTEDSNLVEDFYLQHYCPINIISNSTFSFWSAFTNPMENKLVVAPKNMVNNEFINNEIMLPYDWIKINNIKMITLEEIGANNDSDKKQALHNFYNKYEQYFNSIRNSVLNRKVRILELGVGFYETNDLQVFQKYFNNNCEIIGIDIEDKSKFDNECIKTYICDLSDTNNLITTLNEIGIDKYDIIIDDAQHIWTHQINSLFGLYKYVIPYNGIYILEDLHTSLDVDYQDNDTWLSPLIFINTLDSKVCSIYNIDYDTFVDFRNKIKNIVVYNNYDNMYENYQADYPSRNSITSVLTFYGD